MISNGLIPLDSSIEKPGVVADWESLKSALSILKRGLHFSTDGC